MSLSEWLGCTEIIEMGAWRCRERKRNQTVVSDRTDMGYQVYLWLKWLPWGIKAIRDTILLPGGWRVLWVRREWRDLCVWPHSRPNYWSYHVMPCTPSGLTVRPRLCKPLTSVLVCLGPFLHGLHPLPSPASIVCLFHFPFCELYLTPFTISPVSATCYVAWPTWG